MICPSCGIEIKDRGLTRCNECGAKLTIVETYSRVVGFLTPVENWHDGKQAEFKDRKKFDTGQTK